jgi:hypothetical protein
MKPWMLVAIVALVPGGSLLAPALYLYQRRLAQRNARAAAA